MGTINLNIPYGIFILTQNLFPFPAFDALLEAIYFKKPLLVNRYPIFAKDIEPKGFDLVIMDGILCKKTIQNVREILKSPARREKMVNLNYEVASRYYSYSVLRNHLNSMINEIFGESEKRPLDKLSVRSNLIGLTADPLSVNSGSSGKKQKRYMAK
jgi:hypothetical protein